MATPHDADSEAMLEALHQQAVEHTQQALAYMEQFGVKPGGEVQLFLPPETRQHDIHRLPYAHEARQTVVYETEPGEFSALCPFSGIPDYGVLRIEYEPGAWIIELKSLKYYVLSWRNVGVAQEDATALIYEDVMRHLDDPGYLVVSTVYNVRGGINTTCTVDSRRQHRGAS